MEPTLYPDSDGQPIGEDTLHYDWIVRIEQNLEVLFHDEPDVFVAGSLLWYPVERDDTTRAAPDSMVVLGRPKGRRSSYKQWEEGNIAPQVVFEILAPGNRPDELARKFEFYERYGVDEFYIYNPDTGHLEGWRRAASHFEEVPQMAGFVSPRLGIRFQPREGPDNLKIITPDGMPFLTYSEAVNELRALEQLRLDKRPRSERYAAKLRALGIEPD